MCARLFLHGLIGTSHRNRFGWRMKTWKMLGRLNCGIPLCARHCSRFNIISLCGSKLIYQFQIRSMTMDNDFGLVLRAISGYTYAQRTWWHLVLVYLYPSPPPHISLSLSLICKKVLWNPIRMMAYLYHWWNEGRNPKCLNKIALHAIYVSNMFRSRLPAYPIVRFAFILSDDFQ